MPSFMEKMRLKYQLNDRLAREVRALFNYYFTSFSIISVLKTVKLCQGMTITAFVFPLSTFLFHISKNSLSLYKIKSLVRIE